MLPRRSILALLGTLSLPAFAMERSVAEKTLRIRTLTAGVGLASLSDLARIEAAIGFLLEARRPFEDVGYQIQTVRIATSPVIAALSAPARVKALAHLQALDRLARDAGVVVSIGPVLQTNRADDDLPGWIAEAARTTRSISCSIVIASGQGVHAEAARIAAETMRMLAQCLPQGLANFRFAAAANIPAGTPFFPVAWHQGAESLAVGLESASLVEEAFAGAGSAIEASERLKTRLTHALKPVQEIAMGVAARAERAYLGIDTSPAPGIDRSIAAAIEAFVQAPFGGAGTLEACSAITAAIKSVDLRTCGYSGLMLPVLEDPMLARRAGEGRFGIRDLLLYSSVCGTGLDVVPIPFDAPTATIASLLRDVAAMSVRLSKPLSARLFMAPGKRAGDAVRFDDPVLTDGVVMKLD
jgi:uncharacterized protein